MSFARPVAPPTYHKGRTARRIGSSRGGRPQPTSRHPYENRRGRFGAITYTWRDPSQFQGRSMNAPSTGLSALERRAEALSNLAIRQ